MKEKLEGNPPPRPGYSKWIEHGTWYTAPTVDHTKFGRHDYDDGQYEQGGVRDCKCGCFMLSSASGGPVDPFGACPANPLPTEEHAKCTLCCKVQASGFFTGCMIRDVPKEAGINFDGWTCDGRGNLSRKKADANP